MSDVFKQYVETWKMRGYPGDIPDEVPHELMVLGLAPSWKAIALAILKNDWHGTSLGFSAPHSQWYDAFKSIELAQRDRNEKEIT